MIKEVIRPNAKINDTITDGLWRTGNDRYVVISEIESIDYLQKILYTVCKRETKKANTEIIPSLENLICLYYNILNRFVQLGVKPDIPFIPMDKIFNSEDIIEQLKELDIIMKQINSLPEATKDIVEKKD